MNDLIQVRISERWKEEESGEQTDGGTGLFPLLADPEAATDLGDPFLAKKQGAAAH